MAASPNGKFFASGDRNGGIHVWDLNGNEIHALRDHQGSVTALAFRSDSKLLASTGEDGQLIIWDMKKGSAAKKVKAHNKGITALHYHRNGHLVTAGRDRIAKIFKPDFNEKTSFKNLPEIVTATALSTDGKHLFMADYNGEVLAYDVSSNKAPTATLESNPPFLKDRLADLTKKVSEQSQQVAKAKSSLQAASQEHDTLASRIDGTRKALQKNETTLKDLNKQIKKHVQEDPNPSKDQAKLTASLKNLRRQEGEIRELTEAGRQSLKALEKNLPALKQKLAEPKKNLDQALAAQSELTKDLAYWQSAK